jgi:hypothetical protein
MLNIIQSEAKVCNPEFKKVKRIVDKKNIEDNIKWILRNLPVGDTVTRLVMVGGNDAMSFRLRVAQSHVRHDLTPSKWSHIMLLGNARKDAALTPVIEISLDPSRGFGFPAPSNGVQDGTLRKYGDPKVFPNIAVLAVPVDPALVLTALERFKMQRSVLDSVDMIIRWLSFLWGVSHSTNPLLEGLGIPSAGMLDVVVGAAGYDLTPGLESRSSCPEAAWQAAKWWYSYYAKQDRSPITGAYWAPHHLLPDD